MIDILINSHTYSFSPNVPIINKGTTHGIIKKRDLRLLFLTFLKPIINGIGFSYKEVTISEEKKKNLEKQWKKGYLLLGCRNY